MNPLGSICNLGHDYIDASIQKGVKDANKHFPLYWDIDKRNNVYRDHRPHKIIIQLEIGMETVLFSNLEPFKCINLIKISSYAVFACL